MAKIMVFDGERHVVRLLDSVLRQEGHEVENSTETRNLLTVAKSSDYDFIIVGDPNDGYDVFYVLSELQKINIGKKNRFGVIALTKQSSDGDVFRGWSFGVDSYYTKPFDPKELCMRIDSILSQDYCEEDPTV